jgi:hypothetical protein
VPLFRHDFLNAKVCCDESYRKVLSAISSYLCSGRVSRLGVTSVAEMVAHLATEMRQANAAWSDPASLSASVDIAITSSSSTTTRGIYHRCSRRCRQNVPLSMPPSPSYPFPTHDCTQAKNWLVERWQNHISRPST